MFQLLHFLKNNGKVSSVGEEQVSLSKLTRYLSYFLTQVDT